MESRKLVAALHDLVGLGRCSLSMAIPVFSAMGVLTCPVPTAVFSAPTQYPQFIKQPLTSFLSSTLDAYVAQNIRFDAAYSGYLGDAQQIDIVKKFMDSQQGRALRIVDPVFADDGRIYPSITQDMVIGMRSLIGSADIITPNLTEAAYLLGEEPPEAIAPEAAYAWLRRLHTMGPRNVLITSCTFPGEEDIAVLGMDEQGIFRVVSPCLPVHFPGNGDLFASVLTGSLMQGHPLRQAARRAAGFVFAAMEDTIAAQSPVIEGVRLENNLRLLWENPPYEQVRLIELLP